MKKILLLLCIGMLSVSCVKSWWDYYAVNVWYVRNSTKQVLILKCPYSNSKTPSWDALLASKLKYQEFDISPGTEIMICNGMIPLESKPWFNYYFIKSAEAFGEDVYWQVLSEDGVVLKTWTYSERGMPDQRFFDGSEWSRPQYGLWSDYLFTITDDDLEDI